MESGYYRQETDQALERFRPGVASVPPAEQLLFLHNQVDLRPHCTTGRRKRSGETSDG